MKLVEPGFDINCCWGFKLDAKVIFSYDVCIIVDVLSFSTSLDLLLHTKQNTENILASTHLIRKFSSKKLKITSPVGLPQQLKLHKKPVLVGCMRNARAVARIARQLGNTVLVIPMGDKLSDDEFKTCSEDFIAAGAIISYMKGTRSPESNAAQDIYNSSKGDIEEMVKLSSSARQMILKGFSIEVDQACQFNKSKHVPLLEKGTLIDLAVPEYSPTTTEV
jgi:2-phosphosulfolactate phosphatase